LKHPLHELPQPIGILADGYDSTKAYWLDSAKSTHSKPEQIRELNPKQRPNKLQLKYFRSIVVVRVIPLMWLKTLTSLRRDGVHISLLLDDNLLDIGAISEQPVGYRWRLWQGITRHRHALGLIFNELWVTTPMLAAMCKAKISGQNIKVKLMPLQPLRSTIETRKVFRIAYLGTASHRIELLWMHSLLHRLQAERSDCLIELVLSPYWRQHYKSLPRARYYYPMDWKTYLLDTGNREVDLLLVPLLPSRFNLGRSPTKFFEAARLRAAGLYSLRSPYGDYVRHGVDGLLLPDSEDTWLESIIELLRSPDRISQLAASCRERAISTCITSMG
jgi:hypothetical protein